MHTKTLLLLFYMTMANTKSIAQQCPDYIFLDILKKYIVIPDQTDTAIIDIGNGYLLKEIAHGCHGDLYFEKIRAKDSVVIISGSYKGNDRKMKGYAIQPDWVKDPTGTSFIKQGYIYRKPNRNGVWSFLMGAIIVKKIYH